MALAILARMLLGGLCAGLEANRLSLTGNLTTSWLVFLSLRWLAGLIGTLGLAWMTWLTLKIPNTQSATGILYAAMILAFIGELTAQLMSSAAATRYNLTMNVTFRCPSCDQPANAELSQKRLQSLALVAV
jgi:hypothetical protein